MTRIGVNVIRWPPATKRPGRSSRVLAPVPAASVIARPVPSRRRMTPADGQGRGRPTSQVSLTILDAYAVLAYLKGERSANEVRPLLGVADSSLTALGVAEVLDDVVRLASANEEDAALDLAQLGLIDGVPVDSTIGAAAGLLRARRYHRTSCQVSLADCVAAEVARARRQPLATADAHLLDLCHAEGIAVTVLRATDGLRWAPPATP